MPWSADVLDEALRKFVTVTKDEVKTAFDIGPGAGKYGNMLSELNPECDVYGVEIEPDCFRIFGDVYRTKYKQVVQGNVMDWFGYPEKSYDLVIFGDVIEHLPKSQGRDILDFFMYRSKYILIQYPHQYLQNPADVNGYFYEAHLSVWTDKDFEMYGNDTNICVWNKFPITVVAMDGFIPHTKRCDQNMWKLINGHLIASQKG